MRARRSVRSAAEEARQNTAMTSDATVMSKPSCRGTPCAGPPSPTTISRSARSFMSMTRRKDTRRGSIPSSLPWKMWLSMSAHRALFALVTAWKSPVKCRLMSSMGSTCERPPPVAPPFMPRIGPRLGSRRATIVRFPARASESASPTVSVDLPSPAGVGETPETSTTWPSRPAGGRPSTSILALYRPYSSRASRGMPTLAATSSMGRRVADWAISRSLGVAAGALMGSPYRAVR